MRRTLYFVCAAALAVSGFALARGVQPSSTGARSVPPRIVQQLLRQTAPLHAFRNGPLAVAGGARSVPPRLARQLLRGTAPLHAFTSRPLAGARASANSQQFADPTGDSGAGPDISFVSVSNDDSGNLTIQVTLANRTSLGSREVIYIPLDTDLNPGTGSSRSGVDYALITLGNSWHLVAWNGSYLAGAPAPTFSASFGGGILTFKGNRTDLGNTNGFNFNVVTNLAPPTAPFDFAPDSGIWTYKLGGGTTGSTTTSTTTTTTTTTTPPPPLTLGVAKLVVGTPKAGGKWLVSMIVFRKDTGDLLSSGKLTCSAKAGARPLQFVGKVGPASGLVACKWKVPKTQKGKRATGSMKVLFQGTSVSRSFSKKIL